MHAVESSVARFITRRGHCRWRRPSSRGTLWRKGRESRCQHKIHCSISPGGKTSLSGARKGSPESCPVFSPFMKNKVGAEHDESEARGIIPLEFFAKVQNRENRKDRK